MGKYRHAGRAISVAVLLFVGPALAARRTLAAPRVRLASFKPDAERGAGGSERHSLSDSKSPPPFRIRLPSAARFFRTSLGSASSGR